MCPNASLGCKQLPLILCPTSSLWSAYGLQLHCLQAMNTWISVISSRERGLTKVDSHTIHQKKKKGVSLPRDSCFYNRNMFFPPACHSSSLSHSPPFAKQTLTFHNLWKFPKEMVTAEQHSWVLGLYWHAAFKSLTQVTLPTIQPHCIK